MRMPVNAGKIASLFFFPVAYGLLVHFIFDQPAFDSLFSVVSISFVFVTPVAIGVLTAFFYRAFKWGKGRLAFALPSVMFVYFLVAWFTGRDHYTCLGIAFPPFMLLSFVSGLVFLRLSGNRKFLVTMLLLPFLICPLERLSGAGEGTYESETSIVLRGEQDSLWKHVMGFRAEPNHSDKQGFLQKLFPKPVEAIFLNGNIGEERKAVFSNGIVFRESIVTFRYGEEMDLVIHADPSAIPPEALDKHLVIGGKTFDLISGRYTLKKLREGEFTLSLSCKYHIRTNINFYASFWASFIIEEIQMSILAAIKERSKSV